MAGSTGNDKTTASRPRKKRIRNAEIAAAQDVFLVTFRQTGNVSASCRKANVERSAIYRWLEHDTAFTVRYHEAEADAQDVLRGEAFRRAVLGWDEPAVSAGKVVIDPETGRPLMIRKHSDAVLLAMLKARVPEYRDRSEVDVRGELAQTHKVVFMLPEQPSRAMVEDAVIEALPAPRFELGSVDDGSDDGADDDNQR